MDEIIEAVKGDTGIRIHFKKGEERNQMIFSIQELIDAHINVYHLIQYPGKYRIDIENHQIVRKKHGQ
jgi:hypothetical protein